MSTASFHAQFCKILFRDSQHALCSQTHKKGDPSHRRGRKYLLICKKKKKNGSFSTLFAPCGGISDWYWGLLCLHLVTVYSFPTKLSGARITARWRLGVSFWESGVALGYLLYLECMILPRLLQRAPTGWRSSPALLLKSRSLPGDQTELAECSPSLQAPGLDCSVLEIWTES